MDVGAACLLPGPLNLSLFSQQDFNLASCNLLLLPSCMPGMQPSAVAVELQGLQHYAQGQPLLQGSAPVGCSPAISNVSVQAFVLEAAHWLHSACARGRREHGSTAAGQQQQQQQQHQQQGKQQQQQQQGKEQQQQQQQQQGKQQQQQQQQQQGGRRGGSAAWDQGAGLVRQAVLWGMPETATLLVGALLGLPASTQPLAAFACLAHVGKPSAQEVAAAAAAEAAAAAAEAAAGGAGAEAAAPSSSAHAAAVAGQARRGLECGVAGAPLQSLGGLLHLALLSHNAGPMLNTLLQWGRQWGRQCAPQAEQGGEEPGCEFKWRWDEPNAASGHTASELLELLLSALVPQPQELVVTAAPPAPMDPAQASGGVPPAAAPQVRVWAAVWPCGVWAMWGVSHVGCVALVG